MVSAADAAKNESLLRRQLLSLAPAAGTERDHMIGRVDLPGRCPPGCAVLTVANGLGLDAVERVVVRENGQQNNEQHDHHADRDQRRYRLILKSSKTL